MPKNTISDNTSACSKYIHTYLLLNQQAEMKWNRSNQAGIAWVLANRQPKHGHTRHADLAPCSRQGRLISRDNTLPAHQPAARWETGATWSWHSATKILARQRLPPAPHVPAQNSPNRRRLAQKPGQILHRKWPLCRRRPTTLHVESASTTKRHGRRHCHGKATKIQPRYSTPGLPDFPGTKFAKQQMHACACLVI